MLIVHLTATSLAMTFKYIKHLLATLVVGGIMFFIWDNKLPPFYNLSLGFDDTNFAYHDKKPDDSIVFVAIDERSVNTLGRWPWDRKVVAKGLEQLVQSDVLLFDMVFSEPTNDVSDETLGEAIGELPSSVCGFFLRHKATQYFDDDELIDSSIDDMSFENVNLIRGDFIEANILPVFENCTMQAAFSTFRDDDNIMRQYPLMFKYDSALYPTIGMQALRLSLNTKANSGQDVDYEIKKADEQTVKLNGKRIEMNDRGFTRLNFYPIERYKKISFLDVYNKKYSKDYFKDKIVILGIIEAGVEDVRATPIGAIPGPILHYTFLSNYLQNDTLKEANTAFIVAAILFLVLPFLLTLFIKRVSIRGTLYLLVAIVFIAGAKYAYIHLNLWVETFYPLLVFVTSIIINEALAFTLQEKEAKFIQGAFSSYLSPILLDKLKDKPELLQLGGETKEMTVFFSDIRSFTSFSEKMTPKELVTLLNRYFTPMAHIVRKNEGMLDKYIGDAIMAFYNAPIDVENHAKKAARSALEMMAHLKVLNEMFEKEGLPFIDIGIGLNTAEVIVGNMGSDDRFNYTVIGDGVNLASRVEGLNKNYRTNILITEFTYAQLDDTFLCRELEAVQVKGKNEAIMLLELMDNTPKNQVIHKEYTKILETLYKKEKFDEAAEAFNNLHKKYNDRVSELFYEKSIENSEKIRNHEVIGAVKFTTK